MLHSIQPEKHGPLGEPMAHAVQACVHCGFCLSVCPTYAELGQEMDSPRGRIVLMKQVLEGSLAWEAAQPHIDRCLGCLACEPACPSGVSYRDLISPFRALAGQKFKRSGTDKLRRWLAAQTIPYPSRFRLALRACGSGPRHAPAGAARLAVDARPRAALGAARANLAARHARPRRAPRPRRPAHRLRPAGARPRHQHRHHRSARPQRRRSPHPARPKLLRRPGLAHRRLGLPPRPSRAATSPPSRRTWTPSSPTPPAAAPPCANTTSSCAAPPTRPAPRPSASGSWTSPSSWPGSACARRPPATAVRNASPITTPATSPMPRTSAASRATCCAPSPASSYSNCPTPTSAAAAPAPTTSTSPQIAAALGEKKAKAVLATGAEVLATGNIGCLTQLRAHFAKLGSALPVRHTIQVLRDAYAPLP